ncbi:MAG: xanthine dehydrogenase family protein subunit M [Anaerolineales bacterium]|nr:xanthine dehydrogenase family protein subunit M [Anaerolineales bacterium]MCB8939849.1 xanthine dehydrogenase family protein subunit M [Ardenticatenaceae bacterium]
MKPAPFEYVAPNSLDGALAAMQQHGFDAKPLAGGQSLVPVMNFRLAQPGVLIDLNGVPGLDGIWQASDGSLHFGSMVRQARLEREPLVAQHQTLLAEALSHIAHPQIRNRGTFGGSLAHADPAAELPLICVALNGRVKLQSATAGERWVAARDFYTSLFTTDIGDEELLVEIALPPLPANAGTAFTEMARRHGDYALSGVAAVVTVDGSGVCTAARLVYLNAGEVPMVAEEAAQILVGERPSEAVWLETAVAASQNEIDPRGDIHATADYKRHLAKVLTVRALKQAFARAKQ